MGAAAASVLAMAVLFRALPELRPTGRVIMATLCDKRLIALGGGGHFGLWLMASSSMDHRVQHIQQRPARWREGLRSSPSRFGHSRARDCGSANSLEAGHSLGSKRAWDAAVLGACRIASAQTATATRHK